MIKKLSGHRLQRKVKIVWSSNFSYGIGLLTSDGWLSYDGRHIGFKSKDEELAKKFKKSFRLTNHIGMGVRGGEKIKKYFALHFGDIIFYKFLNSIGLYAAKSKTIKMVKVPKKFFPDFLRGVFDGDGTCYSYWDKRWPNSFVFQIAFSSASHTFIDWLKSTLTKFYGLNGVIHKGDGVLNLRYVKGESEKLFSAMYHRNGLLFLKRKYIKMRDILKKDRALKLQRR